MAATRRVDEEYMSDSSRIPQGMEISDSSFGNYSYGLEFAKEVGLNSSRFVSYQWSWYVQDAFIYKEWSRKIWSDFVSMNCSLAGKREYIRTEQKANDWTIIITVVAVRSDSVPVFFFFNKKKFVSFSYSNFVSFVRFLPDYIIKARARNHNWFRK